MISLVPLVVLLPLIGAAAALLSSRRPILQRGITVVVLAAVAVIGIVLLISVDTGETLVMQVGGWPAPFGVSLVVDRLSALMVSISAIVLLAVLIFAIGQGLADGDQETPVSIYHPAYLVLAAGVFNAFIAGDLFNLYVGFEILLVASYVLLTLGGTEPRIRAGTTYIVVSLLSSLLFLAAIAMLYASTGTVNIAQLSERIGDLPAQVQTLLHVMLLVAFGIKAAVFPLSFWLPDSYPTAPAPVTAVFAGLLTKVGVYAIIRTETILFPSPELNNALLIVALLTMVVGILGAIAQADIKRMLSFTLVSHIGYMVLGVGLGTAAGVAAAIFYTVHHIVVQTTLFLATGLIERRGGTTSINSLGGLLKASPIVGVLYFIPALNLGGIPPFSGFLGKLGLLEAAAEVGTPLAYVLIGAAAVVSLFTLYPLARTWNLAFWRPRSEVDNYESMITVELHDDPWAGRASGAVTGSTTATRSLSGWMVGATTAMVAVSVGITVLAGPLYALSTRAGADLQGTERYVSSVLGPKSAESRLGPDGELADDPSNVPAEEVAP
ncbi:Na+/H+ antiporter subunit D [Naasia lichenicola]|uniref:Na+/H+ antiporter subunit D n=1 Tax=Naasia lichenicola TaxID=2565933 RepID=A0A4S4FNL0_9MICO|nr:Na+/H+ antiporter subunit D [Naasia lichenicola]THG31834.1 Na+/H+ antiporter subunit D [Naasia lichenicola]